MKKEMKPRSKIKKPTQYGRFTTSNQTSGRNKQNPPHKIPKQTKSTYELSEEKKEKTITNSFLTYKQM